MKWCDSCKETFAADLCFCPVDGKPLNDEPGSTRNPAFSLTIVDSVGLPGRLVVEVRYVLRRLQEAWPDFRNDPIGTGNRVLIGVAHRVKQFAFAPYVRSASLTAIGLVLCVVLLALVMDRASVFQKTNDDIAESGELVSILLPVSDPHPDQSGVGVGSNGRVGLRQGTGEGSNPEPQRARGGGGGGDHSLTPAVHGSVPPPSEIPAPINPPIPHAALPVAGVDLDPALWRPLPVAAYGDPLSHATLVSKGPGVGGGIGAGDGLGINNGSGNGVGPGKDGNMGGGEKMRGSDGIGGSDGNHPGEPNRVYRLPEVTQRALVISKPEALYSEAARRNQIMGTVVLRVVFSMSGEVTNIRALNPLPMGLTENAIAAARRIRFRPATKNGRPVSVYVQLEYNFNIY